MAIDALVFSTLNLLVTAYIFFRTFGERKFSSLYWLSVLAVFTGPGVLDVAFGLPFRGLARLSYPFADPNLVSSHLFAFGHVGVTWSCYFLASRLFASSEESKSNSTRPMVISHTSLVMVFGSAFLIAGFFSVINRSDLTKQWNDFLDPSSPPRYELYFLLATAPLMAILEGGSRRGIIVSVIVGSLSFIIAWFIGIRYYMFPFLGYFVWNRILNSPARAAMRTLIVLCSISFAWVVLTFWGVVRDVGVRDDPLSVVNAIGSDNVIDVIKAGNELQTRLAYYDLVERLPQISYFRRWESMEALALTAPYPFLMRLVGVKIPESNSQQIYQILTGRVGTGVSHGATVFGNDWFAWGWGGMIIGGIVMGLLLFTVDYAQQRRGTLWLLVGPLATFQLIFFARGGTDAFLGNWFRYIPISLTFFLVAFMVDRNRGSISSGRPEGEPSLFR